MDRQSFRASHGIMGIRHWFYHDSWTNPHIASQMIAKLNHRWTRSQVSIEMRQNHLIEYMKQLQHTTYLLLIAFNMEEKQAIL